jgi:hypothetical protein
MNTSIEEKAAPAVLAHEMSDPEMFVSLLQGFRESQNPGVRGSVDLYPAEWYVGHNARLFAAVRFQPGNSAHEVFAVAAVTGTGELVSLCAIPGTGGLVKEFLSSVHFLTHFRFLRCLETDKLRELYKSLGLRRVCGMPWDSGLKPEGWDVSRFGRPSFLVYASKDVPGYDGLSDDKDMFTSASAMDDYLARFGISL